MAWRSAPPVTNGEKRARPRGRARYPQEHGGHGSVRARHASHRVAVLIVVALFVLKFAFGLVIGLIQFVFVLAILAAVALGVIWALRHI